MFKVVIVELSDAERTALAHAAHVARQVMSGTDTALTIDALAQARGFAMCQKICPAKDAIDLLAQRRLDDHQNEVVCHAATIIHDAYELLVARD